MRFSSRHIKVIRVAFALLVFSASSGLTALVHTCTMTEMSCCAQRSGSNRDDCSDSALPSSGVLLKSDFTCHTNTLVGGLAIKLALIEKESRSQMHMTPFALLVGSSFSVSNTHPNLSQYHFALAVPYSPPSVDKYVLFGSFLI
jgi:hypothetical protein